MRDGFRGRIASMKRYVKVGDWELDLTRVESIRTGPAGPSDANVAVRMASGDAIWLRQGSDDDEVGRFLGEWRRYTESIHGHLG
jgi:hypothetical protein